MKTPLTTVEFAGTRSRRIIPFLLILATIAAAVQAQPAQPLHSPVRLALASKRRLVVSDHKQRKVFILDTETFQPIKTISVQGRPLAVATFKKRTFVGNETRQRVEVYNPGGNRMYDLGGTSGTVKHPTDMAIDPQRRLVFVLDGAAKTVKVFRVKGPLLYTISAPGRGIDQLVRPTAIAIDPQRQEVLVSDYGNPEIYIRPRVQIFHYTGDYLGMISGKAGMFGMRFSRPQGLAVDGNGHVFLVDSLLGQVLVFDRDTGALLKSVSSFGSNPGQLRFPLDVALDPATADLYVTNNRLGRIEVFREGGLVP